MSKSVYYCTISQSRIFCTLYCTLCSTVCVNTHPLQYLAVLLMHNESWLVFFYLFAVHPSPPLQDVNGIFFLLASIVFYPPCMTWVACWHYLSAIHPSLLHAWGELLVATTCQPYTPPFFTHEVSCLLLLLVSRTTLPSSCMRWAACCYYWPAVHPFLPHAWGELLVATTCQPYTPPLLMHEVSCLLLLLASRTSLPYSCMMRAACF